MRTPRGRISFPYIAFDIYSRFWYNKTKKKVGVALPLAAPFCFQYEKGGTHGRVGITDKTVRKEGFYIEKNIK